MNYGKLLDVFLFPRSLYKRITDGKATLYPGILLIGIIDMVFPLSDRFTRIFTGKPGGILTYNIAIAVVFTVLLGIVDVLFFTLPMYDLFKYFKKRDGAPDNAATITKLIKIYITAHFVIIPINAILLYAAHVTSSGSDLFLIYFLAFYFYFIMPVWFAAVISRGVNVIYGFQPLFRTLVFVAVFLWNFLLGFAFEYMTGNWVLTLFK